MLKEKRKNIFKANYNMEKQNAITLIALIITIIILLILAGVTLNFLIGDNSIFLKTKEAAFKHQMQEYKETVDTYLLNNDILKHLNGEIKIINAGIHSENANIDIKEVIPNLKSEHENKVEIENNEFEYVPVNKKDSNTQQEVKWCFEIGIKVKGYNTYEEFLEGIIELPDGKYVNSNGIWCSEPDLTGFNVDKTYYVTYDNEGNEKIGNSIKKGAPEDWYDYANKKWANIVTISDGGVAYFVWIPRYVYMIDEEAKTNNTVKVRFVDKTNKYKGYIGDTKQIEEKQYSDTAPQYNEAGHQTNYCLSDAFTWGDTPLAGYWLSKYEVSASSNVQYSMSTNLNSITIQSEYSPDTNIDTNEIYIDGNLYKTVDTLPCEITGLKSNTTYTIRIIKRNPADGAIINICEERVKTLEQDIHTLTKPDLTGFNTQTTYYVTYDDEGNENNMIPITSGDASNAPEGWYDYANKKWANIVTVSEGGVSYFVWVPRYEYKIKDKLQTVDIRFITKDQKEATSDYKLSDAFKWGETSLGGYWLSKYEVSAHSGVQYAMRTDLNKITIEKEYRDGAVANINTNEIYVNGEFYKTVDTLPCEITDLSPNTTYTIRIIKRNPTGNLMISVYEEQVKTLEQDIKTLTKPDLTGFSLTNTYYVTYNASGEEDHSIPITSGDASNAPEGWYDYENKKWANIVTISDGKKAYFVWVPRYEYKIKEQLQMTDIRFITKDQKEATNKYKLSDAFKWGETSLGGYWLSKYEVSE